MSSALEYPSDFLLVSYSSKVNAFYGQEHTLEVSGWVAFNPSGGNRIAENLPTIFRYLFSGLAPPFSGIFRAHAGVGAKGDFSLPSNRYLNRHHLLPFGLISRNRPCSS